MSMTPTPPKNPMLPQGSRPVQAKPTATQGNSQHQLHPAAQEASIIYSNALHELDRVRADNAQLRNELEVERRHCQELQYQLDRLGQIKDYFQRYAVEVQTHLTHIAASANTALDKALDVARGQEEEPEQITGAATGTSAVHVEDDVAALAKKFAPKQHQ